MTAKHGRLDEDGRCVLSDLPPDQCSGCRQDDDSFTKDNGVFLPSGATMSLDVEPASPVIRANFPGKCPQCGGRILVGDQVVKVDGVGWICQRHITMEDEE